MTVPSGSGSVYGTSFSSGTIAAGGSQPVTIQFAPTAAQSYSGTLTVNGDQTSGTNTISISGTGTLAGLPLFTVVGVVSEASGGAPIGGANVRINDGPYTGRSSSTDGNGYYSIAGVNGAISLIASKAGYDSTVRFLTLSSDTRFDMTMGRTAPPWSQSGTGDSVFNMPTSVSRVRITATPASSCQNFAVKIAGRLIVNVILGTCSVADARTHDGTYLTSGGVTEVTISSGVSWSFTQVR